MNDALLFKIADYSNKYREEFLSCYRTDELLSSWWKALDFFLGRACFQGRRDDISERVYRSVKSVLADNFSRKDATTQFEQMKNKNWDPIKKKLTDRIGPGKVGKNRDIDMVLSSLDFIGRLSDLNMVNSSIQQVQGGNIEKLYYKLQRSEDKMGIIQVGPKIASFYLRDLVCLFELESKVPVDSTFCVQPIDVWVRKVANKLNLSTDNTSDTKMQKTMATVCKKHGISLLKFNQGAWYAGYHSFDLLLETLSKN